MLSAVFDPLKGFAYFGTANRPGCIVRVSVEPFQRVDAIQLEDNELELFSAVIDPTKGYAYFGASERHIVVVDLKTFTRLQSFELMEEHGLGPAAIIDPEARFAYFGTCFGSSTDVVRVSLKVREQTQVAGPDFGGPAIIERTSV